MIPYGRQTISEDDVAAVVEVLRGDWLTQGPAVERFERAVAEHCGVEHAIACANGTAALHLAYLGLGLAPGDLLWTSPNTFVATANAARFCGADMGFVDIERDTLNMSVDALEARLADAERSGRLPDVVVPVHFGGAACDMMRISELSRRYGFTVVEDASHAIGGAYRGTPVGACERSSAAVFSFHPVKIVTTGEGGMVVTNDDAIAERARLLRTHGITRDPMEMEHCAEGPWYYEQLELGFNYRITDIQCALGASQMRRLDEFVARRNELARRYDELLAGLPVAPQRVPDDVLSAYHLYVVRLDLGAIGPRTRTEVFAWMRASEVGVNVHYIPVHLQPYYERLGFGRGDLPEAERYYAGALTLPLYPAMSEDDQDAVVAALREAVGA
ncbi:MAG: UDP-4-amino-4,6-dideoxy-N-acetyl-beta-L-altrosamine transaminase [Coriobacteriia bacterium]|nr:UDP-4-amino-4,6-dideoxy-N-acetyl-beta-L-altrosamine transaminase [Coriobacteriia bacterium]